MPTTTPPNPVAAPRERTADIRLRAAFLVSGTGDWIYRLAIPLLVLKLTGSAASTAFAYAIEFIPYIVVGLFAGVIADRFDRRRLMILCDGISAALALVITAIALLPHPPVAALYVCAFVLACVRPFYFPAFQGFLVDVVPEHRLARTNSWTQTADSALSFLGPVAGLAFVAAIGPSWSALLNAVSFAASAGLIASIGALRPGRAPAEPAEPAEATEATEPTAIWEDFRTGLRTLWELKPVFWGTLLMALSNLAAFTVESSLFYLVLKVERMPNVALGLVLGGQGLGAVVGAVLAERLTERFRLGSLLAAAMGFSGLTMVLPVVAPSWWAVLVGWSLEGIATSVVVVAWFTARQTAVPSELIGRTVSVGRAVAYLTIPLGALLGGQLVVGAAPARTVFGWAAAVQGLVFLGTLVSPVRRIGRTGQGDAVPSPAAATEAAAGPAAGPAVETAESPTG
ncbi:MFS transporter [Kitasatospora viridis]|uniref:Putative MFS family arabinose efflux permease n=1 Tax=Kitasatospora viridis TaxID=281105 RepID=A0A561T765_9ACTN|nr:MFS transporter [Kitasatospora viridis]TWF82955.1 putative MFS family arabinose efflux permease [Kitasatospora viridis]